MRTVLPRAQTARTVSGVAVTAFAVVLLSARGAPAAEQSISRHTLPNGMVVLVRENAAARVVAASLQVRAGSRDEPPEAAGITNFLHRVMLRGTVRRSALELSEAADELGGTLDASGEVEYGEVRGEALAQHWAALLDLIAEVALTPALRADEMERERRLILGQLRSRGDAPFQRALDALVADLYGPHPYGWPAVGLPDPVGRLTPEALQTHYRSIYRADRMVLAVSGAVPREEVVRTATRLFAGLPPAPSSTPASPPKAVSRGEQRVIERSAQQAQVLVGFLGPSLHDPDYAAMRVLGAVLGSGMSGRLFVELRDRRGLAYSIGAAIPFRTGPSSVVAYLGTAPANVEAAHAGVLAEVERVRREPVSESELVRAKAYLLGALAMDRRTNARHAWYLAFFEGVGEGWDFPERYARAIERVSVEDVRAAAERYLTRPTTVVLRPPAASGR
jgi:zinc protease